MTTGRVRTEREWRNGRTWQPVDRVVASSSEGAPPCEAGLMASEKAGHGRDAAWVRTGTWSEPRVLGEAIGLGPHDALGDGCELTAQ